MASAKWGNSGIRVLAAAFLVGAAAIHFAVAPEHFEEGWTYGLFFLLVGAGQAVYAPGILASRVKVFRSSWYLVTGIASSFMLLGLYLISRLVGMESFGFLDVTSKILEVAAAALLIWLLVDSRGPKYAFRFLAVSAGLAFLGAAVLVALADLR